MTNTIYSLLIAATLSVTGSQSFANTHTNDNASPAGGPATEKVMKTFPNALIKNSETKGEMTKVTFTWNGDNLEAYYNQDGELLATTHILDAKTLPISIRMEIGRKYDGYVIAQATEFYHADNGLSYFVIVKKGEKALILQVQPDASMTVVKKLKN